MEKPNYHLPRFPLWLVILFFAVFFLRLPSFFEPYRYGDEMIYLTLGQGIKNGVTLYKDLHDNKPPLIYLLGGLAGNLFWFKFILAIWNLATIFIFWKLAQALFPKNKKLPPTATVIFALLTSLPLFEGNIANSELFMIGPIILSFLVTLKKKTPFSLFIAGLIFSLAILFKVPAAFDFPAVIFLWLIKTEKLDYRNLKKLFSQTLVFASGVVLPIVITLLWFYFQGALTEYITAAFLQNLGYLSSWRPVSQTQPFLVKNGPLLIRGGIVIFGLLILYFLRKKLPKEFSFLTAWLLLSLFGVTLSERPYPHYFVQALPSLSLLLGILITEREKIQTLTIIPLTIAFFVPIYFRFWYYPTLPFYLNFIKFTSGSINKEEYFQTFDSKTNRNYALAKLVREITQPKEKIFVWGDTATIYALSKRLPPLKYVADYHIKDFSSPETVAEQIGQSLPALIIITPEAEPFPELDEIISRSYQPYLLNIDGVKIFKLKNSA